MRWVAEPPPSPLGSLGSASDEFFRREREKCFSICYMDVPLLAGSLGKLVVDQVGAADKNDRVCSPVFGRRIWFASSSTGWRWMLAKMR